MSPPNSQRFASASRPEVVEHLGRRPADGGGHLIALEPVDRGAEDADGRLRRRHRGVPAGHVHGQLHAHVALLRDPDERQGRASAGHDALRDRASLVHEEVGADVARPEQRGDLPRAGAAHLFVGAEREVHRPPRLEPLPEERFHRLEDRHEVALVVERAAPPDVAVGDAAAERRLGPAVLGSRLDGHDILVGEQEDRLERRVAARPAIEQVETGHALAGQARVNRGKRPLQIRLEPVKLRRIHARRTLEGDRPERERPCEPRCGRRRVDGHIRRGFGRELLRAVGQRLRDQQGGQQDHEARDGERHLLHGVSVLSECWWHRRIR